jgi:predicted helicase
MVVLGNPPYLGLSKNKGKWISELIDDYKYVDGEYFNERKHWLNDDYVKFIRLAENFVEKNGEGVLAYITNHGYIENPTFRGMRWHLAKTFDEIYVIDLHGNSKKKEKAPDGSKDENVFDIEQGVGIILAFKTGKKKAKKELAKVFHSELFGSRESKYEWLFESSWRKGANWNLVDMREPFYTFAPIDFSNEKSYAKGFKVDELFPVNVTGIVTARDGFVIDFEAETLLRRIEDFSDASLSDNDVRIKYFGDGMKGIYPAGDSRGWKLPEARKTIQGIDHKSFVQKILYRPYDLRTIYYHSKMVDWGREKYMRHFLKGENIGLVFGRRVEEQRAFTDVFVSKQMIQHHSLSLKEVNQVAPLYLYPDDTLATGATRTPNLDKDIVAKIESGLKLSFVPEKEAGRKTFAPIDILDYIYAMLHSPAYKKKYDEFLRSDFPRIPYPKDAKEFWRLVELGGTLRKLHLLEAESLQDFLRLPVKFPVAGDCLVDKKALRFEDGKVWINQKQYFDKVPESVWNFQVGGYTPAQKWLKDRDGRKLLEEDLDHYARICEAMRRTQELVAKIDAK